MAELAVVAQENATIQMQGTRLVLQIAQPSESRNTGDITIEVISSGGGNRLNNEADIEVRVIGQGSGNRPETGEPYIPIVCNFVSTNIGG